MAKAPSTEQMSAELREKGRQAFLEPSEVKQRLYHGTTKDIAQFDPTQAGSKTGNPNAALGTFLSDNPSEANRYATQWGTEGGNVMPVHVQAKNPYHMSYKEFNDLAMGAWNRRMQDPDYDPNARLKFSDREGHKKAAKELQQYHDAAVQDTIKRRNELIKEGHDSIITKIGGNKEYIMFHPTQIKSAIGNRGTYDTTNPDINKAQGGVVHLAAGKSVEQMSAELREKGRQAFLKPSEVKQRMYHGTGQDIRQFRPKQAGASFVTPDPKFAHDFADLSESWMKRNAGTILTGEQIERAKDLTAKELTEQMKRRKIQSYEREIALIGSPQAHPYTQTLYANKLAEQLPSAQNIMPVHVQAKKPFDYENPKHVHAVRTMLHKLGHTQHIDDFDTAMRGGKGDNANWHTIESKPVQQAIRALGHDSFWVKEGGVKNLGVYNPGAIKSAIGNRGTYDTEDYDINKAQGGAVAPVKLKEGKQPPYQDPKTSKIDDWIWHPMERIRQELSARRELPEHVTPYADYMREMNAKAQRGELTPRDFVKAYTITQSSIGRGGLSHATATKRGMKLPNTGGEVRPEGAFAEWLGSPMGQKYLEASMRGEEHPEAMEDLRTKFAPFGKQNAQVEAMQYATQNAPTLAEKLNAAVTGSKADYRKFAGGIKGIASAKSGFIGSLLGRGDLPTLDARQLNLHSLSHPTKTPEGMMSRGKGLGGQEAVDRLIARQDALGYKIPKELEPYAQHLIHHDVWDQRGGTKTTHEDLIKAMLGYADGGDVDEGRIPLDLPKAPVPSRQEMQAIVDRIARQQAGEFVKGASTPNLAGRSLKEFERIQKVPYSLKPTKQLRPTPVYHARKGDVNIVLPGDLTVSDKMLEHVNNTPIGSQQEGGSRYGEGKLDMPEDKRPFWASGLGAARAFQNKVTKLARLTGEEPRVIAHHLAMASEGNNFAMHLADVNLKAIKNSKIAPENVDTFNRVIRAGSKATGPFPDFPGVHLPEESYAAMRKDSEMRKFFNNRMKTPTITKPLGLPNGLDIDWAVSHPELRNMEINMTGHSVGRMKPGADLVPGSAHKTYSHDILGESLGRAPELAPLELSFLDATHFLRQPGQMTSPGAYTRTMTLGAPHQVVDDRYLNMMNDYYTKLRATRGFAKGGNVSMDEMLAHTTLGKKAPNVRNIGADEAPDMKVKQYIPPGPSNGLGLPAGGVDFQPEMPGQQLSQAAPAGPGGPAMPGMPGMPPGAPGMPPGAPGPGMPGMPPPLPRNQPGMPTGKPAGLEPPNIPPPKQKPTGSNILSMTPQGQALAALGPMRKMAKGGAVDDTDYRGEHAAPGPESGKPMHDTTDVYPADFYGPRGFEYYANTHQPYDRASYDTVAAARGKPDKMVWVHRAVPKDVYNAAMKTSAPTAHMIRPGDWVTPSREYARDHGERNLGEGYHIARQRVPAKHLYTNADSIHEWGYHPEPMRKMAEGGGVKRKIPEMETAVKALLAGVIDYAEYDRIVANHKPVKPYDFVPQPASDKDAARALMENKKAHWRGAEQWPAGRKIGMRLDIPAYEHHGVWVNSIHDEEGTGDNKFNTSYAPVSSVKNAVFDAKPSKAERVATGEQSKSPFARIKGELHHMSENEAVKLMQEHLHHPDWAQVGMDPRRHGFFYDRKTMQPVTHSEHVVQIGPLVLAKKPKYGKRETYAHGGGVTLPPSTEQMRQALSARRSNSKA